MHADSRSETESGRRTLGIAVGDVILQPVG